MAGLVATGTTMSFKEDLQRLSIPDELHYMQGSTGW